MWDEVSVVFFLDAQGGRLYSPSHKRQRLIIDDEMSGPMLGMTFVSILV
jgi:hypothetical protein